MFSADIFFNALLVDRMQFDNDIVLQNILFGYVVGGTVPIKSKVACNSVFLNNLVCRGEDLDQLVSRFWEMERVPQIYPEYPSD